MMKSRKFRNPRLPLPTLPSGRSTLIVMVAITFGVIGVLAGVQWMGTTAELRAASVFPEPRPVAPFELHTATGERFSEADLFQLTSR